MPTILQQLQSTGEGKNISNASITNINTTKKVTPQTLSTGKITTQNKNVVKKDYGMGLNTSESEEFYNKKEEVKPVPTPSNMLGGQNVYTQDKTYTPLDIGKNSLDKAILIAKAIRQQESGGDYSAKGNTGEVPSAYQFLPSTWKAWAKEILGDENAPLTRENQNKVATLKIQKWLNDGFTLEQVAAAWNSGEGKAKSGAWKTNIGTTIGDNGKEVPYNTPQYVKNVMSILSKSKGVLDFNENVNIQRAKGRTDTEILSSLGGANPNLQQKIIDLRKKTNGDNREVLNQLSLSYSGKLPTVASVPDKVIYEDDNTIRNSQFGYVDTGNEELNKIVNFDVEHPLATMGIGLVATAINPALGAAVFSSTEAKETGKDIGNTIFVNSKDYDAQVASQMGWLDSEYKLIKAIQENKKVGKDNTRLVNQLISSMALRGAIKPDESVSKTLNKTNAEIITEWAMLGADVITGGIAGKAIGSGKYVPDVLDSLKLAKNPMANRLIKNTLLGGSSSAMYQVASNPDADFGDMTEAFVYGATQNMLFGEGLNLFSKGVSALDNKIQKQKIKQITDATNVAADTITGDILKGRKKADPIKVRENVMGVISNMGKEDIDAIIKSDNPVEIFYDFVQKGNSQYGDIANKIVENNNTSVSRQELMDEYTKRFADSTNKMDNNNPETATRRDFLKNLANNTESSNRDAAAIKKYIINDIIDTDTRGIYDKLLIGNKKFGDVYNTPGFELNLSLLKSAEKIMVDAYREVLNKKMTEAVGDIWKNVRKQQGNFLSVNKYLTGTRNKNLSNVMSLTIKNQLAKRIKTGFAGTKVKGNIFSIATYPERLAYNVINKALTKDNTEINNRWKEIFNKLKSIREAKITAESLSKNIKTNTSINESIKTNNNKVEQLTSNNKPLLTDEKIKQIEGTKEKPKGTVFENSVKPEEIDTILKDINENGGITYNLKGEGNLGGKEFYSVSIYPERSLITDTLDKNTLADYIEKNADLLYKQDHQLGGWYDKESGKLYLDVAVAIPDKNKAIDLGKKYNQKAIFDLSKFEEIPTGGTGENIGDFGDINTRYNPEEIPKELKPFLDKIEASTENIDKGSLSDIYKKSFENKKIIDEKAKIVADKIGGELLTTGLKEPKSSIRKITEELSGNINMIGDIARNTIVVKTNKDFNKVSELIQQEFPNNKLEIKKKMHSTDVLGYSDLNIKVVFDNGTKAEIQVNTPDMIYAKDGFKVVADVFGLAIAKKMDLVYNGDGGKGHKFYEEYKKLNKNIPSELNKKKQIIEESKNYYKQFLK